MANARRGEIDAVLDGNDYRLCLTLGALAELEQAFGDEDMLALATRFEAGRISARDAVRIIGAGLRGAGYDIADSMDSTMRAVNGVAGFVEIVARLLAVTFAGDERACNIESRRPRASSGEADSRGPFPGTR